MLIRPIHLPTIWIDIRIKIRETDRNRDRRDDNPLIESTTAKTILQRRSLAWLVSAGTQLSTFSNMPDPAVFEGIAPNRSPYPEADRREGDEESHISEREGWCLSHATLDSLIGVDVRPSGCCGGTCRPPLPKVIITPEDILDFGKYAPDYTLLNLFFGMPDIEQARTVFNQLPYNDIRQMATQVIQTGSRYIGLHDLTISEAAMREVVWAVIYAHVQKNQPHPIRS
ncbi:MAG: hypothetical protein WC890_06025 [Candidatus Margulisiibacteriota bacterium]